jgi:hypothetical protein
MCIFLLRFLYVSCAAVTECGGAVPSILQPVPETDDDKAVRRLEQRDAQEVTSQNTYNILFPISGHPPTR